MFYSGSTLERVNSFLKKISQTINLAGSCWVLLFPELLLSALHIINLGSVYLKSTVNVQKYCNHSCSILGSVYLKSTVNLQKCSNQCCSILANVYSKEHITLTYLTYGSDNLIQLLLFSTIHGKLTAFSYSIIFFQHWLEINFGTSVALNKEE